MPGNQAMNPALAADVYPDGVARRSQLLAAGLTGAVIARRCRPNGPWRRLLRGVILLTGARPTRRQRVRAALLHARADAVVTGVEALRRLGVRRLPDDDRVHVLIPNERQIGSRGFVVVERTRRMPDPVFKDGFPLAPAARALVDAAKVCARPDSVRTMIADAIQRRVCTVGELAAELAEPRRPETALARAVLTEIGLGVRSAAEAWALGLLQRSRMPSPDWNVELCTPAGRRLAVVDAYWKRVGLAWEIDSREFHLLPEDHARGAARQSRLAAAGVLVVHTLPTRLRDDPGGVLHELEQAYLAAANRPTPAVATRLWRPGQAANTPT
jgi:hypothetical protein